MNMEVLDGLTSVDADVGDKPIAAFAAILRFSQALADLEHPAPERMLGSGDCGGRPDVLARYHQDVGGRLRVDISKGDDDVVHALIRALRRTDQTIAVAESCTGGLIAYSITAIPDVSPYFPGGIVTYSNMAKVELLGVPAELIATHGAVSSQVAEAMAQCVRERFRADIGLSVTGIAGPGGGTAEKPVGLVYLGLATADAVDSRKLELGPEQPRDVIQRRSAKNAMNWARLRLEGVV